MPALFLMQLKIKESFHIEQLKPELNKQVEHVSSVVVGFLNLSTAAGLQGGLGNMFRKSVVVLVKISF